ncbi:MAG: hypothetical protein JXI33_05150 [Candidatus Aminicenantes bacterium]|nr:hypothetical protein [Candidatus Aminicenantes bacterium]
MIKAKHVGWLVTLLLLATGLGALEKKNSPDTLTLLLGKAAMYCEKLKTTAFKYFCLEQVNETLADSTGRRQKNVYRYDYQIIAKDGKISEQRTLLFENGKKRHLQKAKLPTRIFSYYSFHLPVFLLAKENQSKFNYQLQAVQMVSGSKAWGIKVVLKELAGGPMVDGQIWLDAKDYSVIKIELNPRYFARFEQLQKEAMKAGAILTLSDVHWYELKRNGIRFPSQTEIREIYTMSGPPPGRGRSGARGIKGLAGESAASGNWDSSAQHWKFDRSKTVFTYSQHRFFNVDMEYSAQPLLE